MMVLKLFTKIVKCTVPESGVRALGRGNYDNIITVLNVPFEHDPFSPVTGVE